MLRKLVGKKSLSLELEFANLEREWLSSSQRASLLELVRNRLLPNQRIDIDSALCLGLGSLRDRPRKRLRSLCSIKRNIDHRLSLPSYGYETSSVFEDGDEDRDRAESTKDGEGSTTFIGDLRNMSLYQLLLYETVLECLRSRFTISSSLIQDPKFTATDCAFLQRRGHTVVRYPHHSSGLRKVGGSFPPDPSLLQHISESTFFFAPGLDIPISVDILLAARPSLYWGYDMCLDTANVFFLSPISPIHSLLDSFVALARSYAFIHAPLDERSGMEYGFMYPVDTSDQSAMKKVQQRMGQANVEAQKLRPLIVGIVEKRKHEQKRKPWTRRIFERRRSQNMKIGNDGADQLKEQGRDGQTEMAVPT